MSTGSIPKKKQSTLKGRDLSGAIIRIADDHSAAVSRKDFQAKLNQIKNLSNEELVKFVKNFKFIFYEKIPQKIKKSLPKLKTKIIKFRNKT